jgi:putative amide transporter protein
MTTPNTVVLLGANMLYVAAVLFIIAKNTEGKCCAKEAAAFAFLCGLLNVGTAFYSAFILGDAISLAGYLLFGFTYWMLAINVWSGAETFTGLGWYCFFVMLSTIPFIYLQFSSGAWISGIFWVLWGYLWGVFWVMNGLKRPIATFTAISTYGVALVNGLVAAAYIVGWLVPTGLPA